jgi:hypothetical protein
MLRVGTGAPPPQDATTQPTAPPQSAPDPTQADPQSQGGPDQGDPRMQLIQCAAHLQAALQCIADLLGVKQDDGQAPPDQQSEAPSEPNQTDDSAEE